MARGESPQESRALADPQAAGAGIEGRGQAARHRHEGSRVGTGRFEVIELAPASRSLVFGNQARAASIDPTITIGNPIPIPSVSGSPRSITPRTIATSGFT